MTGPLDDVEYPTARGTDREGREVAVVVCSHGNERSGKVAVDCLLRADPEFTAPVRFLVGNERALTAGRRFTEGGTDLNRSYPGDPAGETYERRRAAELLDTVAGARVLDVHATHSTPTPFVTLQEVTAETVALARATGVERVVDIGHVGGALIGHVEGVALEVGPAGTPEAVAAANAHLCNFLGAVGAANFDGVETDPTLFRVEGTVGDGTEEFVGTNFQRVEVGETYAVDDGGPVRAEEPFYPVLMSDSGYDDKLGYSAVRVGSLSSVPVE